MRLDHLLSKEKETVIKSCKRCSNTSFAEEKPTCSSFIFQCTLNIVLYNIYSTLNIEYGAVAQLARAPALQAGGQEFDSPQLHHTNINFNYC